ncbi:hypothetical protein SAMN00120144_2666 [Hymenobacter roseosalivarius DSM 11622]|uniref:Phosphoesterase PA-phosphatase related n=1 Tax=Hymenobacter roseosalivarius DSM 11622 TaxID=645990 RepID=A0A1W1VJS2_9BACT|nr:hypothetical protein SAMN00120144_2666 [Hymenobacter roseosalivarius DSM 11622]
MATALSLAFHPLLVPSYLFYVVCYQLPVVAQPALPDRWIVLAVVFGFTFLLPALGTGALFWFGRLDSLLLRERAQRPLPLLLATFSFAGAAFLLHQLPFSPLLSRIMLGMAMAVLLTLLISLRWKISAHGVGVGGSFGLFVLLHLTNAAGPAGFWWLLAAAILALAVLGARLALDAHTPAQAWAGLGLGISVVMSLVAGVAFL